MARGGGGDGAKRSRRTGFRRDLIGDDGSAGRGRRRRRYQVLAARPIDNTHRRDDGPVVPQIPLRRVRSERHRTQPRVQAQ